MATYWENSCSFGLRYVSWYKYLIVSLVFSHLGFWSGNLFLIAPFPDLCLLVPFFQNVRCTCKFKLYYTILCAPAYILDTMKKKSWQYPIFRVEFFTLNKNSEMLSTISRIIISPMYTMEQCIVKLLQNENEDYRI